MLIKYILISIIGSITNLLPISYSTHIYIFQNLLNTNIFNDNILINSIYISIPLSIIYTYKKDILKYISTPIKYLITKDKTKYKKNILILNYLLITTILSTITYTLVPKISLNIKNIPIYLIILSIIIFFSTNKKNSNKNIITLKTSIIFGTSNILTFIPTISPLCSNLLVSKLLKYNKSFSLKYSLLSLIPIYIIKSIPILKYLLSNQEYLAYILLTITITTIISIKTINYLKYLYNQNKLYKLSIYLILLSLFLLYWYR